MEAKDFRIGNYVNFKDREDIDFCEITDLSKGGYFHILRNFKDGLHNDDQPENIEHITPILLTEEWLLRLRFNKKVIKNPDNHKIFVDITLNHKSFGLCSLEFHYKDKYVYLSFEGTQCGIDIKYVHQLQNLYFALTGNELTIK